MILWQVHAGSDTACAQLAAVGHAQQMQSASRPGCRHQRLVSAISKVDQVPKSPRKPTDLWHTAAVKTLAQQHIVYMAPSMQFMNFKTQLHIQLHIYFRVLTVVVAFAVAPLAARSSQLAACNLQLSQLALNVSLLLAIVLCVG